MADRKHLSSDEFSWDEKRKKCQITYSTFEKWQRQFNIEYQSLSWLRCDKDKNDKSVVSTLWCEVCRQYENKICSFKNFSKSWIEGSGNHRTSNVVDHATSGQHSAAMNFLRIDQAKERREPLAAVAPIVNSLLKLDDALRERLRQKFDLCFVMAKEGIPFTKYPVLYQLESRHEVDMGLAYNNDVAAKCFTHYIAESQRKAFVNFLKTNVHFFSFLMDGTTDVSNTEDEAIAILYCKKDDFSKQIESCTRYLGVTNPNKADANGLLQCLVEVLKSILQIQNVCERSKVLEVNPILVGGGTDGASVNIAQHTSIKSKLQNCLPWIYWSWCYAHRLELSSKDGLISVLFKSIQDMLLRLYYLYEKSPKKVRELKGIVEDLKEVFSYQGTNCIPVRSQGSRWLTHKRRALQKVIDQYGAYINHLITLSQDTSVKSEDRARLKGYILKWSHSKFLLGSAMYIEVLKCPSILSLCLQKSNCDIVYGLKQILKAADSIKSLRRQDPSLWPTVKLVLDRIHTEGSFVSYQGAEIKYLNSVTLESCKKQVLPDLERLNRTMQRRLEWFDVKLLRALIAFLETQSWMKRSVIDHDDDGTDASLQEVKGAIEVLSAHFRDPLEAAGANLPLLQDEIEDVVVYARTYLGIESTDYRKVWYNLFVCPNASEWPNVLLLCELAFSLPFSNARVEQIFSSLKYVKNVKRIVCAFPL